MSKTKIDKLYKPSVCGVGYIGVGKYGGFIENEKAWYVWYSMLRRCYSKKALERNKTYDNCSVDERWHNFQVFAEWFYKNFNFDNSEVYSLDKDILIKGNKIYSPETCCFVPKKINGLFVIRSRHRGSYALGVSYYDKIKKYKARVCLETRTYLGVFDTEEQAFQAYKIAKEKYIKEIADEWRDRITSETYIAMYNYKVEITD